MSISGMFGKSSFAPLVSHDKTWPALVSKEHDLVVLLTLAKCARCLQQLLRVFGTLRTQGPSILCNASKSEHTASSKKHFIVPFKQLAVYIPHHQSELLEPTFGTGLLPSSPPCSPTCFGQDVVVLNPLRRGSPRLVRLRRALLVCQP
jgi:hypothetical protein